MSFMYHEGTADYLDATTAIIRTYVASGSIAAGKLVPFMSATDQRVYQPAATYQGNCVPAGLAIATVADGEGCPVLVWGVAKNVPTGATMVMLDSFFGISGSGTATLSGAAAVYHLKSTYTVGRPITGSSNSTIVAYIDCM